MQNPKNLRQIPVDIVILNIYNESILFKNTNCPFHLLFYIFDSEEIMDLERLKEFEAIAKTGSIKQAARTLGLSSATLSARLIRFEEHIGTPLFRRTADAMVLTPAGEQLLPSSGELLSNFQKVRQKMLSAQAHSYHQLRIAVCGSELPLHLGPFLDRLNLNNPDIHLEILDDSRYSIVNSLLSGEVDLYFAPVMEDFPHHGLIRTQISTSTPNLVLPRSHRLAERTMVSIRELEGETFLLYPETAEPVIRNFQLRNLTDSGISYQTYHSETPSQFYMMLVPVGKGVVIHPTHLMGLPPFSTSIPLTDLPHQAPISFFYSKTNPNPDVQAFARDFILFTKEPSAHEHKQAL